MAYTTESAVRAASGFSNTTNITTGTVTAYIADADRVIDSYVADIYSTPLSATSEVVEMLSRYITIGLLYANEYGEESQGTDKGWKSRLDWAMDQLQKIKDQKMKLYDSSGVELSRSSLRVPSFYPTESSSEAGEVDEPRFTMTETF